jgi:hypothetical protein
MAARISLVGSAVAGFFNSPSIRIGALWRYIQECIWMEFVRAGTGLTGIGLSLFGLAGIYFSKRRDGLPLGTDARLIRCSFFANGSFNAASIALTRKSIEIKSWRQYIILGVLWL